MRTFILGLTRTWLGLIGTVLTTVSAILFVILFAISLTREHGAGPYFGIVAFMVLPGIFVAGLLLIPLGFLWEKRRERLAAERGEAPPALPVLDFANPKTRQNFVLFLGLTLINIGILAVATYKGVEFMDSTTFCGKTCHSVMQPEYTTYSRSPHARVNCVSCHIGPGADWFVKSKLSGTWQIISVNLKLYPKPIPTPVHSLRPARETCEQCHWPDKFTGDKLRVITRYAEDETNTPLRTVLLLKVGGRRGEASHGIHWHVDPGHRIRYRSDPTRETIYEVEAQEEGGKARLYRSSAADSPEAAKATEWRTMDCVDCHNRPTHIYRTPEGELDQALLDGRIDATLPWIRREGLAALKQEYASHEAARTAIRERIAGFYQKAYAEVASGKADAVEAAAKAIGDIYCWNVFPSMNIGWGTYPNHIGHTASPGCTRCHGGEHATPEGETIAVDCSTCHTLLAQDEPDPEILKTLNP